MTIVDLIVELTNQNINITGSPYKEIVFPFKYIKALVRFEVDGEPLEIDKIEEVCPEHDQDYENGGILIRFKRSLDA